MMGSLWPRKNLQSTELHKSYPLAANSELAQLKSQPWGTPGNTDPDWEGLEQAEATTTWRKTGPSNTPRKASHALESHTQAMVKDNQPF